MLFPRKTLFTAATAGMIAALAGPAPAQDLLWHDPAQLLALAGAPRDSGSQGLRLLSHGEDVVAVRVWYPPNTDIAPHPHPAGKVALVTVVAGAIELGLGDSFDADKLKPVPAGSTIVLRADDPQHFGRTGPDGVQLLLIAAPTGSIAAELTAGN